MNSKERVLQELRENGDISSLSEARQTVKQRRALRSLTEHSQKLGRYSGTNATEEG